MWIAYWLNPSIYVHVCMYVCMYVRMYVSCVYVCRYVHKYHSLEQVDILISKNQALQIFYLV